MQESLDFYSTSAQVLPVILLVVLFEAQQDAKRSASPGYVFAFVAASTLLLVAAQVAALRVLYTGTPTDAAHRMIDAAYSVGAITISLQVVAVRIFDVAFLAKHRKVAIGAYVAWIAALSVAVAIVT